MKIKQIKLSLSILLGLIISSYGFLISAQEGFNTTSNVLSSTANQTDSTGSNMTKDIANKISRLATSSTPEEQEISLAKLQQDIADAVSKNFSEDDLPEIPLDSIKIKPQNYKGTAEQIKSKKKEDLTNYMVAFYYILSSNSPTPITSNSDVLKTFNNTISNIALSISSRQSNILNDIQKSGEKMFSQLQEIEVPKELVGMHIKSLRFAQYATSLKSTIDTNVEDPLLDLSNLAKLTSFVSSLSGFYDEAQSKFAEYGIEYDDIMMQKINQLGAPAPDPKELEETAEKIKKESLIDSSEVDDVLLNNISSNEN